MPANYSRSKPAAYGDFDDYNDYDPGFDDYDTNYDDYDPGYDDFDPSYDDYDPGYDDYDPDYGDCEPYYDDYGPSYDDFGADDWFFFIKWVSMRGTIMALGGVVRNSTIFQGNLPANSFKQVYIKS